MDRMKKFIVKHIVTILFVMIAIFGVIVAKQPMFFLVNELVSRIARNSFLVLALIIPVIAGMGLNFSIVIGAMAGQVALIIVSNYGIGGVPGLLLAVVISIPVALVFGNLTGRLLNKTKGQEMIASMIVGFFANGVYQFVFLFLVGTLIPMSNERIVKMDGVGLRNTIDLAPTVKYALDGIWKMPLFAFLSLVSALMIGYAFYLLRMIPKEDKTEVSKKYINIVFSGLVLIASLLMQLNVVGNSSSMKLLKNIKVPMVTMIVIALLMIFNLIIFRTKLGQDFKAVGQNQHIAKVAGIKVEKMRILAITLSTMFASIGQIIFLQNIGVLNTFGSHMQIGLFSVAALLVGGASVNKATVGQAILGVVLFHTLFIVSPYAGKELFGDPQIGEFFRSFVAYGVIGLSLILYAWKKAMTKGA